MAQPSPQQKPHPNDRGVLVPPPEGDSLENVGVAQPGTGEQPGPEGGKEDEEKGSTTRADVPTTPPNNP
ncbi:hypothetical protein SAMN06265795_102563 [Noviherbaspirillum humi]|uniref:Uncharacterized protein n=1 Tax=Noviherbaspirillum humi TaxID=1688639 RepID=A0A239E739_9BURK|nr:hypothetical protein [Noviherbaspirillum humi]SNS40447.1 hypothetical protein SAMN06265795_102563 [Noviherbaspirillum humi]